MTNIDDKHIGKRVDVFLLEYLHTLKIEKYSRSMLKDNWGEFVMVNGIYQKPSYKIKKNDKVEVNIDNVEKLEEIAIQKVEIKAQEGNLEILYEDKDMLIINKQKGMVVHPGLGNIQNTISNYVKGYLEKENEFDPLLSRAGLVHRLDKGVSGVMVFAKNSVFQRYLQKQFEEHSVRKIYLAGIEFKKQSEDIDSIVPKENLDVKKEIAILEEKDFQLDESWVKVEGYIKRSRGNRLKMEFQKYKSGNAKYALSYIKFIAEDKVLIIIKTGRMHQIRATLSYMGINIKGDTLYSSSKVDRMPDGIELESVYLSFEDSEGKRYSFSTL